MANNDTVRTSPKVPKRLLNDFKTAIQVFNDGKLKGRFGPSVAEAMHLYLVAMYARNPDRLKNMGDYVDPDEISQLDNPDDHQERVINYQDHLSATVQDIALQLQRDSPGAPTTFEEYVRQDDVVDEDSEPESKQPQLNNSILG